MITAQQRLNLAKLADGLAQPILPVPEGVHFNMRSYSSFASREDENAHSHCGAVGCAVGMGTYIVEPRQALAHPFVDINNVAHVYEEWEDYCHRVFGVSPALLNDCDGWTWMFSGLWSFKDNSHRGAAARIRWFLDNGVPDDMHAQCNHHNYPLCYRKEIGDGEYVYYGEVDWEA